MSDAGSTKSGDRATRKGFSVGETVAGKYRVLGVLGRGGFGTVYLVEIVAGMVGEKLALKLLSEELSAEEKVREQFVNEIRVAMRLVDKYIIQIRDVGTTGDGLLYYTMDYSPGVTLKEILQREKQLPVERTIRLLLRVLRGLQGAHAQGVIHRDLKPANLMVEKRNGHETLRILDFGIATAVQSQTTGRIPFAGSPHYMPPEQFLGDQLGFYTDLYSVGVILYECLTGDRPYRGNGPQEVYDDMKSRPVVPPDEFNPELRNHAGLVELVLKSVERNPQNRFQSAREFFNDLQKILDGAKPPETRPAVTDARGPRPRGISRPPAGRGPASRPPPLTARRTHVSRARRGSRVGLGVVLAAIILSVGVIALVLREEIMEMLGLERPGVPSSSPGAPATSGSSPAEVAPKEPGGDAVPSRPPADRRETPRQDARRVARTTAQNLLGEARQLRERARSFDDWVQLRELARDALRLDDESASAYQLRGVAEFHLELFGDAEKSFQKALENLLPDEIDPELHLLLAKTRLRSSPPDREGARAILAGAVEKDPASAPLLLGLLKMLEEDGEINEIKRLLLRAKRHEVADAEVEAWWRKYVVELSKRQDEERKKRLAEVEQANAEKQYRVVVEKGASLFENAPSPELGFMLSRAHLELGNTEAGLSVLKKLAALVRNQEDAIIMVAILFGQTYLAAHESSGDKKALEGALMNLSSAVGLIREKGRKVQPKLEAMAFTYLARCHAHGGDLASMDEEIRSARRAYDREPGFILHQGESYYLLGKNFKDEAGWKRAISRLEDYNRLADAPKEARVYYLQGLCYFGLGRNRDDFRQANNKFASAFGLGLESPEFFNTWAQIFLRRGDLTGAAKKYRESYNLEPAVESCYWAGRYFHEGGFDGAAEEILDLGIQRFGDSPGAMKLRDLRRQIWK